jgi:DNA-directed RNA polymerase III subunit RPC1
VINPLRAHALLSRVVDEDLDLLWADAVRGRPEAMLVNVVMAPPVCIRPSVTVDLGGEGATWGGRGGGGNVRASQCCVSLVCSCARAGGGSNEDDLTMKLQEIVRANNGLREALATGTAFKNVVEAWDLLQVNVAAFINGELPGLPAAVKDKKPIRGLCQRLKGKTGRFREWPGGRAPAHASMHPPPPPHHPPQAATCRASGWTSAAAPSSAPTPTFPCTAWACRRRWRA